MPDDDPGVLTSGRPLPPHLIRPMPGPLARLALRLAREARGGVRDGEDVGLASAAAGLLRSAIGELERGQAPDPNPNP